ncbi:hypothetical protein DSL72_003036 [Monilinia vaccinii-corymbosi]|uniref:DUF3074 domain-containing protein n=1 Tax=Monilinia vaccinii-corymbosi TaxID=61207 RepID=A0A8A3P548_9HELO|nr:hypothetical protein DSL72_003036 [Monilinia vaccinii-corymbosi]
MLERTNSTPSTAGAPGPLIRLRGLSRLSLPPGGIGIRENGEEVPQQLDSGLDESQAHIFLTRFIRDVLTDSIPWLCHGIWPQDRDLQKYPTSKGGVESYKRTFSIAELHGMDVRGDSEASRKNETWHARRSWHHNSWVKGTATWEEFARHFKRQHFESEKSWCKSVIDARRAMYWDTTDIELEACGVECHNISMDVVEMKHKTKPKPFMKDRTFPVLLTTASIRGSSGFLVISIPLTDFEYSEFAVYAGDQSLVVAAYAAVEKIHILPTGEIEWIMATAADGNSSAPRWIQEFMIKRAVRKDVGMYMEWVNEERRRRTRT